jgi:hypothetical protein
MKKEKRFNVLDYYENIVIGNLTSEQVKSFLDIYGGGSELYLLEEIHDVETKG